MASPNTPIERRGFSRFASAAFASATLPAWSAGSTARVLRVHSPQATRPWDYAANAPWDHTVEMTPDQPGKIKERYFDYINAETVAQMLDLGLRQLTGAPNATAAWKLLLPDFAPTHKITLKLNMNNASFNEAITTNRMDQSMPLEIGRASCRERV